MNNRKFGVILIVVIALATQSYSRVLSSDVRMMTPDDTSHRQVGVRPRSSDMDMMMMPPDDDCIIVTRQMNSKVVCPPQQVYISRKPMTLLAKKIAVPEIETLPAEMAETMDNDMVGEMADDMDNIDAQMQMRSSMQTLGDDNAELDPIVVHTNNPSMHDMMPKQEILMTPDEAPMHLVARIQSSMMDELDRMLRSMHQNVRMRSAMPYDNTLEKIRILNSLKERHLQRLNPKMRSTPLIMDMPMRSSTLNRMDSDMNMEPKTIYEVIGMRQPVVRMRSMRLEDDEDQLNERAVRRNTDEDMMIMNEMRNRRMMI